MTDDQVPQAAYDLYDRYCHGDLSRRGFMERLGTLAVGGLTLTAMLGALLPNYAQAQEVTEDDEDISTQRLTYASPKGAGEMAGYLAVPAAAATSPAVLVVHENRGLNPYIEDVARRLAKKGFVAFAPDALHPLGGYPGNDDEGREMQRKRDRGEMIEDFLAGLEVVRTHEASTGVAGCVGFCFGGSVVNELAWRAPNLSAAVAFYGGWPAAEKAEDVSCPLMEQLAGLDDRVNAGWPSYEKALIAAGKTYSAHMYEGVNHGFHNGSTSRFDPEAAALAWSRTLAFFDHHLRD